MKNEYIWTAILSIGLVSAGGAAAYAKQPPINIKGAAKPPVAIELCRTFARSGALPAARTCAIYQDRNPAVTLSIELRDEFIFFRTFATERAAEEMDASIAADPPAMPGLYSCHVQRGTLLVFTLGDRARCDALRDWIDRHL